MIGINPDYDYLYDRQQDRHVCFCPVCGKEIYNAGNELCYWCMEES